MESFKAKALLLAQRNPISDDTCIEFLRATMSLNLGPWTTRWNCLIKGVFNVNQRKNEMIAVPYGS